MEGGMVDGSALYAQYQKNYTYSKGAQPGFGIASGTGMMSYPDFIKYAQSQGINVQDTTPRGLALGGFLWLLVAIL